MGKFPDPHCICSEVGYSLSMRDVYFLQRLMNWFSMSYLTYVSSHSNFWPTFFRKNNQNTDLKGELNVFEELLPCSRAAITFMKSVIGKLKRGLLSCSRAAILFKGYYLVQGLLSRSWKVSLVNWKEGCYLVQGLLSCSKATILFKGCYHVRRKCH